jgi:hypothetical protein
MAEEKQEKKKLTTEERRQKMLDLRNLLIVVALVAGIAYISLEAAALLIAILFFLGAKMMGA